MVGVYNTLIPLFKHMWTVKLQTADYQTLGWLFI